MLLGNQGASHVEKVYILPLYMQYICTSLALHSLYSYTRSSRVHQNSPYHHCVTRSPAGQSAGAPAKAQAAGAYKGEASGDAGNDQCKLV